MLYETIIATMASKVGVPAALLLAICTHESGGLKNVYVPDDNGSPSHGICQVKSDTAKMYGFKGTKEELMKPKNNIKVAAKYLRYQLDRYDNDWCKATAAYNAGTYFESRKNPGKPVNYKYIGLVKAKLDEENSPSLTCTKEMVASEK